MREKLKKSSYYHHFGDSNMTVINAMKFNENEGGMVADSQSSGGGRKYDFADKVESAQSKDGTTVLFGGAGPADFLHEVNTILRKKLAERGNYDVEEVARLLSEISCALKRDKINVHLKSTFGIDATKALSGEGVGQNLLPQVKDVLTGQGMGMFQGEYVLIGKDKTGVKIYEIYLANSPALVARPYSSTGSGIDESDKVLYKFALGLGREERQNIPFVKGMAALINATNASSDFNQGVGGVPTISYFNDGKIVFLDEESSRLATEIVRVGEIGLIRAESANESLEVLLRKTSECDLIE